MLREARNRTEPLAKSSVPLFWIIFAFAFLIRAVFIFQWLDTPYGSSPLLDAHAYDLWAKDIAQGNWLRGKAFYQSPLYPYLCGIIYSLVGPNPIIIGLLNAVFGALCVALLAILTRQWFGSTAGFVTGLLAATYRPFIFYSAPLMKEPLALLLLVLFMWRSWCAFKDNKTKDYVLSGIALGLAALVRGNVLFLVPVVLFYAFRKRAYKKALWFLISLFLSISPATFHNYLASGDFVLINYTGGFNLYIGHSPVANGTNAYPPEVSTDPIQEELNVAWVAMNDSGRSLGPAAISAYWQERALTQILNDPIRALSLTWDKVLAFFNGAEKFDNYDIGFVEENFGTILQFPLPHFWLITTLAAFAFVAGWSTYKRQFVFLGAFGAAYVVSVIIFYVTDRYRLPVLVFLLPPAGLAFPLAVQLVKQKEYRLVGISFFCALLFLWLGLRADPHQVDLRAFNWGSLSMIYSDMGRHQDSIQAFEKGIAFSDVGVGAAAYVRASYAYEGLGDDERAGALLQKAISLFPQSGIVMYNWGRYLAARNRLKEALAAFEKGVELTPHYLLNYYALAKGHALLGNRQKAKIYVTKGLAVDSSDRMLNTLREEIGQ